jgi:hypothetical protein
LKSLLQISKQNLWLGLVLGLLTQVAFAQPKPKQKNPLKSQETEGFVSWGAQLNACNYFGDVPSGWLFTRPGLSVFALRKLSPRMQARLSFSWIWLDGDDFSGSTATSGTYARNLHFRNFVKELALTATYDFNRSFGKYLKRRWFSPYLVAGIALFHHNPQARTPADLGGLWVDLQALGTEGQGRPSYAAPYNKIQLAIPLGLGFKWRMGDRWDLGLEIVPRITFTDYLDDVSGEYPNMPDLGNPLAVRMSNRSLETIATFYDRPRDLETVFNNYGAPFFYTGIDGNTYTTLPNFRRGLSTRGNPNTLDFYIVSGFHLSYIMNVGLKCPKFN